jgi:hypothetical protein
MSKDDNLASACGVILTLLSAGGEDPEEVLRLGPGRASGKTCLHVACAAGDIRLVRAILKAGGRALLPAVDDDAGTCLHIACKAVQARGLAASLSPAAAASRGR